MSGGCGVPTRADDLLVTPSIWRQAAKAYNFGIQYSMLPVKIIAQVPMKDRQSR